MPATLFKRDYNTSTFLWILQNFKERCFFLEHLLWMLFFRSSCLEVFCKKVVLRNFAKFTRKHLRQSLLSHLSLRLYFPLRTTLCPNVVNLSIVILKISWTSSVSNNLDSSVKLIKNYLSSKFAEGILSTAVQNHFFEVVWF